MKTQNNKMKMKMKPQKTNKKMKMKMKPQKTNKKMKMKTSTQKEIQKQIQKQKYLKQQQIKQKNKTKIEKLQQMPKREIKRVETRDFFGEIISFEGNDGRMYRMNPMNMMKYHWLMTTYEELKRYEVRKFLAKWRRVTKKLKT